MKELLYPERKRCRNCRNYFDFSPVLRLYCSRECAGLPELPHNVEDLPRRCRVFREGRWERKAAFFTPFEAGKAAREKKMLAYFCEPTDGCGNYHLATIKEKD